MKKLLVLFLGMSTLGLTACSGETVSNEPLSPTADYYLESSNAVTSTDTTVTFVDASGREEITIDKNPTKVAVLYASYTTLWYETGGTADGIIGGDSASELYIEYIGRDIIEDEDTTVLATSGSGSTWSTETILAFQPDLIICSTAMSGYSTISGVAEVAGIDVVAVSYDSFSDYLKWFKVFSLINGNEENFDKIAMKTLENVVSIIDQIPADATSPNVLSIYGTSSTQAQTSLTTMGAMITELKGNNIPDSWENTSAASRLTINLEQLVAASPEVILIQVMNSEETAAGYIQNSFGNQALWNSLTAVQNDDVYYMQKTLFHNKPNSKFDEAYKIMAEILYPNITFTLA